MALALDASLEISAGGHPVLSAAPADFYAGYTAITPGQYALRLAKPADPKTPLKTINATLPDQAYVTVLVTQNPAGEVTAELLDETPDAAKPPSNTVTVRQFSAGSRVVVTAGGQQTDLLEFGQAQALEHLPDGNVSITMRALTPKGPRNWVGEMDFRGTHRGTVFVFPDTYGRVRFKLTADGPGA